MSKDVLDRINEIEEFLKVHDTVDDEDVTNVLALIADMIAKPDISPNKAPHFIVYLSALSAKFAVLATYYTSIQKGQTAKKNVYYTLRDQTHNLANALKYLTK